MSLLQNYKLRSEISFASQLFGADPQGGKQVLNDGIKQGKAVDKIVYNLQCLIEFNHAGKRFKLVENHAADWVEKLHESVQRLIHNPKAKAGGDDLSCRSLIFSPL